MESEEEIVKACEVGQRQSLKNLIRKVHQKATKERKPTLVKATEGRHSELVKLLLQNGADPNVLDIIGESPLHVALRTHQNDIASAILRYDADVNLRNHQGLLPLHQAAHERDHELVRQLILKGADVNRGNRKGQTPLMIVCRNGCVSLALMLLQNGADFESKDGNGWTAMEYAILAGIYRKLKSCLPQKSHSEATSGSKDSLCKICNQRLPMSPSNDTLLGTLAEQEEYSSSPLDVRVMELKDPPPEPHEDSCALKDNRILGRPFELLHGKVGKKNDVQDVEKDDSKCSLTSLQTPNRQSPTA